MDGLRSDTLHPSESVHSLSVLNTSHMDELSKEKEEELLYGTGDDGDEEDALSDDSMRLRLSDDDDEIEIGDAPALDNQENKPKNCEIEMTSGKVEDFQTSCVAEKRIVQSNATLMEIEPRMNQEDYCASNVSMDEKILFDHEKDITRNENRQIKVETNITPRPWPTYESQRRFSRNPRKSMGHSFRNLNHSSYNRCRYLTPRGGHYRHQLHEYNMRFYNAYLPVERGRGNGMFKSYSRSIYGSRHSKNGLKSFSQQKINSSNEFDHASPSNINTTPKHEVQNSTKSVKEKASNSLERHKILDSNALTNIDKNNDQSDKLVNKTGDDITMKYINEKPFNSTDLGNHSLQAQHSEKNIGIVIYSDIECKNVKATEVGTLNNDISEDLANPEINADSCNHADKIGVNDLNKASSDSGDICITDNLKTVETLNLDLMCGKDEVSKESEKDDEGSGKTTETIITDLNISKNEEAETINRVQDEDFQSEKLHSVLALNASKEDKTKLNNDTKVNGDVTDHKEEENLESKEEMVSTKSKECQENSNQKDASTVMNNLINNKNDSGESIIQSDLMRSPGIGSKTYDSTELCTGDSTNLTKISKFIVAGDQLTVEIDLEEQNKDKTQKHKILSEKEKPVITSATNDEILNENIESTFNINISSTVKPQVGSVTESKDNSGDNSNGTVEVPVATQRRRRRTKKIITTTQEFAAEDKQVRESGRQKRRTAKNAEKIIREEFLLYDSDSEFSDSSEQLVVVNHKINQDAQPLSPPSLKRNCPDTPSLTINGAVKKVKTNAETLSPDTKENNAENIKKLNYIHKFFQRDLNEKLPKLKQEELEELLIQKIVETITMRDEIGRLREQARISEKNQEITRAKCQQLAKQIKDFEMVLNRNVADRRANNDKPTPPIKINRSVGLQVNFITDHGMQNLRQLQQNPSMKTLHISSNVTPNISSNETNNSTSPRRGIKVRSPRRTETISGQGPVVPQNPTQTSGIMSTITPAALVVAKPVDAQHSVTLANQSNVKQIISSPVQQVGQQQQSQQAIVLNGKLPNQINRQGPPTVNITKSRANDLIDLTDEEEKSKGSNISTVTNAVTDQQVNLAQKAQPCFQRVIQTIPANVAITSQPPNIRVVQPASQPTPTALVNNMNAPRLAYVMPSGMGPTRQLLITPSSSPMRPVTSCRASFSTLTYKTGISTIANGTVRVLTTPATSSVQLKHPAPLPDIRNYAVNPAWKLPPPAPSLKISKVANGIILSWNMSLSDKYADIASYQLYAYQEIAGIPPNTSLWKKVGDVRALPLPMACTLTQFSEGNNYYFAVRAVDTHSRKGQYSIPGNISL